MALGGFEMVMEMKQGTFHLRTNNNLPLYHPIYMVSALADYFTSNGISAEALLSGSGISMHNLKNPEALIMPTQELHVFRNAVKLMPDPRLGLIIGNRFSIISNNIVVIPSMFCTNYMDVMTTFSFRYVDLTPTYFRWELNIRDGLAFLSAEELIDLKDLRRFISEIEFASVRRQSIFLLRHAPKVKEIQFSYPRPQYSSYYQEIFHCPVVFGAEQNMVVYDSSYLFEPFPMSNSLMKQAYIEECRSRILKLQTQENIIDRIKHELRFNKGGVPSFDQLASNLNISPRTLRRHLAAHGKSYTELLEDYRKNRAIEWLRTTSLPIERIATELGYSDVPNFYHAFRKWTGTTPNKYRELVYQVSKTVVNTHN